MTSLRLSKALLIASVMFFLYAGAAWGVSVPKDYLSAEEVKLDGAFTTGNFGGYYEQDVNKGWFWGSIGRGFRLRWMLLDNGDPASYDKPSVLIRSYASRNGNGTETGESVIPVDSVDSPEPAGPAPVPEPMTLLLMGTGIAGIVALGRRRMVR